MYTVPVGAPFQIKLIQADDTEDIKCIDFMVCRHI